jgi:hypothetical protein
LMNPPRRREDNGLHPTKLIKQGGSQ